MSQNSIQPGLNIQPNLISQTIMNTRERSLNTLKQLEAMQQEQLIQNEIIKQKSLEFSKQQQQLQLYNVITKSTTMQTHIFDANQNKLKDMESLFQNSKFNNSQNVSGSTQQNIQKTE